MANKPVLIGLKYRLEGLKLAVLRREIGGKNFLKIAHPTEIYRCCPFVICCRCVELSLPAANIHLPGGLPV